VLARSLPVTPAELLNTPAQFPDRSRDASRIEGSGAGEGKGATEMAKVLCATCGIQTETGEEARVLEYGGRVFYFCSDACMELFLADPASYLAAPPEPDA
jgi:YHS domain-containing protein